MCKRIAVLLNTDRNRSFEYSTPRYNNVQADFEAHNLSTLARFASFPRPEIAAGAGGSLAEAARGIGRDEYLETLGLIPVSPARRS
jgi:hypothetical protein